MKTKCFFLEDTGNYKEHADGSSPIYRRTDTGEDLTLREVGAGAMWFADWLDDYWKPQLVHVLIIRLPDGSDWCPDSQASNCTLKEDVHQQAHHCSRYRRRIA